MINININNIISTVTRCPSIPPPAEEAQSTATNASLVGRHIRLQLCTCVDWQPITISIIIIIILILGCLLFHLGQRRKHTQNKTHSEHLGPPTCTPWFPWVDHTCRRCFHQLPTNLACPSTKWSKVLVPSSLHRTIQLTISYCRWYFIWSKVKCLVLSIFVKRHTPRWHEGSFIGASNISTIALHPQFFFCATALEPAGRDDVYSQGHQIPKRGWLWIQVQTAICRLCRCPL